MKKTMMMIEQQHQAPWLACEILNNLTITTSTTSDTASPIPYHTRSDP